LDRKFAALVDKLEPKLQSLLGMPLLTNGNLPRDMPRSGVYLFTECGRHLYVGRSNDLRSRYARHCRPGATHHRHANSNFAVIHFFWDRILGTYRRPEAGA
jgi:hypothetical protein